MFLESIHSNNELTYEIKISKKINHHHAWGLKMFPESRCWLSFLKDVTTSVFVTSCSIEQHLIVPDQHHNGNSVT